MKKVLFVIGCGLIVLSSCCNKSGQGTSQAIAPKDSFEFVMNIPIKIKPEYVSAYKKAFEKCQAGSLQEAACLDYALFQSYTDSTEFHLFERWANKAGHLAHMQTDHFKVYREETGNMNDQPKSKMMITYVWPIAE